jgi:polysaccharide deacetylase 2 family uncharacterized protein YibQ
MQSRALTALRWYWGVVLTSVALGAVVLQTLGPPEPAPGRNAVVAPRPASVAVPVVAVVPVGTATPAPARPGRDTPGPIISPDPALAEPLPNDPPYFLPRIDADGRMPMQLYARGFDSSSLRPRVAILFAGIGLNRADSEAAIRNLPPGISLAFSPDTPHPEQLLDSARLAGHEFLVSLPMEPSLYPQNDPGPHALLTSASDTVNAQRLDWALSRIGGYAGVTGALGAMRGERFSAMPGPMAMVMTTLAKRGVYYVDPRPGASALPAAWSATVDLVIDEPANRQEIDAKLAKLEQIAHDKGSALGLITVLRPVAVERVQNWADGLLDRGLTMAPISAIVHAPPEQPK